MATLKKAENFSKKVGAYTVILENIGASSITLEAIPFGPGEKPTQASDCPDDIEWLVDFVIVPGAASPTYRISVDHLDAGKSLYIFDGKKCKKVANRAKVFELGKTDPAVGIG